MNSLQDGIYYKKESRPGDSLGIIFLRANGTSDAMELGQIFKTIWDTCINLKKGAIKDLEVDYPDFYKDLTVLIGYAPKIFDLKGALRKKPRMLTEDLSFAPPRKGGGLIFPESDLNYHEDLTENHAALDDIVIQFISNKQYVTHQALVEVWRELSPPSEDEAYSNKLSITAYYHGFRRADNRNWTGFHDGVSNIKPEDRENTIAIGQSQVQRDDNWLIKGTFMAFIRIFVDLQNWWKKKTHEQEMMVGRMKSTGCPIIGYDKHNNPISDKNCPVKGTREVIDKGNERFRNHPPYAFQRLPPGISDDSLKFSHIGAMKIVKNATLWQKQIDKNSIYRQGFEFLEQTNTYPGIRAGLNFISFQNDPKKLFNTMTNWNEQKAVKLSKWNRQDTNQPSRLQLNSYFRVGAAGLFFVPPRNENEIFPGSSIFFSAKDMAKGSSVWKS
jgi:deferrochelatase/peroxidase EfeB